jgi:hypothetical protein
VGVLHVSSERVLSSGRKLQVGQLSLPGQAVGLDSTFVLSGLPFPGRCNGGFTFGSGFGFGTLPLMGRSNFAVTLMGLATPRYNLRLLIGGRFLFEGFSGDRAQRSRIKPEFLPPLGYRIFTENCSCCLSKGISSLHLPLASALIRWGFF